MKEKLRSVIAAQGDISVDRIIGLQDTSPYQEEKISYEGYKGYSRTKAKKELRTLNSVRKPYGFGNLDILRSGNTNV